ncbi:uncharacterized protein LOC121889352 [Thunnus maccoyii]|uniref:uncharacterized protein LOC121889352 n=1 Tax=Thunnus maccoyii TaxID=8240 RepID=UPI001C4D138D|nr:uncharacterized protein LOC121889352 [Thunnus maccoyii]XP_042257169.1 uncharacterized protein LOC121889352 [Thunnus maccoyii]
MIWILFILTSSVCGILVVKGAQTFYQAEENDNITIKWDSQTKTDMSHTNLDCVLQSKPVRTFYQMKNGVEVPESQDEQFAGRVQCDEDALREGRIRLHLSRVTTDDSGDYWCDLASYDKILKRWVLKASEHFVVNVTQTSRGENSDVFTSTPGRAGAKHPLGGPEQGRGRSYLTSLGPALAALVFYSLYLMAPALRHLNICTLTSTTKRSKSRWTLNHFSPV